MTENSFMIWKSWIGHLILNYLQKKHYHRNMMLLISRHPYLPLDCIQHQPYIGWDKVSLQKHPQMTRKFYRDYIQRDIVFRPQRRITTVCFQGYRRFDFVKWEKSPFRKPFLSYHPKLPLALVLKFPNMGWDMTFLLLYRRWSIKHIERLIVCRKMNWELYSRNQFINADIVRYFLRYPWDWKVLAVHPSFPPQEIYHDNILFCKWKWRQVFKNPRMSLTFWKEIRKQPTNPFSDPYVILHNKFQFDANIRLWATIKIVHVISTYLQKKQLLQKLKLVLFMKEKMCDDLLFITLSYV